MPWTGPSNQDTTADKDMDLLLGVDQRIEPVTAQRTLRFPRTRLNPRKKTK